MVVTRYCDTQYWYCGRYCVCHNTSIVAHNTSIVVGIVCHNTGIVPGKGPPGGLTSTILVLW